MNLNVIDIVIICIIGLFFLYGFFSGFLKTSIIFIGFALGCFFGYYFPKAMEIKYPLNFIIGVIIFIIFWVIFGILSFLLGKIGKILPFNRFLGGLLGIVLGIIFSFFIFTYLYQNVESIKYLMDDSTLGKIMILSNPFFKK